jgi:predicted nucleic acid-binding protein
MGALERYYLDTYVIFSAIEHPATFGPSHVRFVRQLDAGKLEAVTSELSVAECLVKPLRDRAEKIVAAYLRFLDGRPTLPLLPIDRDILLTAARLRASLDIRLPDAIHVATALRAHCSIFLTNDKRLKLPPEIRKAIWEDPGSWQSPAFALE